MKNIFMNRNYMLIFAVLLTSSLLINLCHQIYQCSCFFVLATSMAYLLKENYGKKIAFTSLLAALVISFALTYNIEYTLYRKTYVGIIALSILSIFASFIISSLFFENRSNNLKYFYILGAASLIDGIIMSAYFVGKFDLAHVIAIFSKEMLFKIGYITLIAGFAYMQKNFVLNIIRK